MAYIWAQCRTEDDARRLLVFALIGSFNGGELMPARISPICPRTVDINFGNRPTDITRICSLGYVEMAEHFHYAGPFPEPETLLQAELERRLAPQLEDDLMP